MQRLLTETKKSLRINNITSKFEIYVSSPLQNHPKFSVDTCLSTALYSVLLLLRKKIYTRTDRKFGVNRLTATAENHEPTK